MKLRRRGLNLEEIKMKITEINGIIERTLERGREVEAFVERWEDVMRRTDDPFERMKAKGYIEYYRTELRVLKRRLDLLKKLLKFHEFLRIFGERMEILGKERGMKISKDELEKMMETVERKLIKEELHVENLEEMVDSFIREMGW